MTDKEISQALDNVSVKILEIIRTSDGTSQSPLLGMYALIQTMCPIAVSEHATNAEARAAIIEAVDAWFASLGNAADQYFFAVRPTPTSKPS